MTDYTLHSYFRSSCSARIRIALNAKGIPYDIVTVNLLKNEHLSDDHKSLNPSASVPVLECKSGEKPFKISQSVAALEYLEEKHPDTPLLPPLSNPEARATVRVLVNVVASDIQPVTNLRIMRRVREMGGNAEEWNKQLMTDGFRVYESVVAKSAGKYSVGDQLTLADVCFVPAYWNAERFGVDLDEFPTIKKIAENLKKNEAVVKAHWKNQPDTPKELRDE